MNPVLQGEATRARIRETLLAQGKMSREALAFELGVDPATVARHLLKMPEVQRKAGMKGGIWMDPPHGRP